VVVLSSLVWDGGENVESYESAAVAIRRLPASRNGAKKVIGL
jgi:hypothetical protein